MLLSGFCERQLGESLRIRKPVTTECGSTTPEGREINRHWMNDRQAIRKDLAGGKTLLEWPAR